MLRLFVFTQPRPEEATGPGTIPPPPADGSKFELHAHLQQTQLTWYPAMNEVLPGKVQFGLPPKIVTWKTLMGDNWVDGL
jgi:hypothetical protein